MQWKHKQNKKIQTTTKNTCIKAVEINHKHLSFRLACALVVDLCLYMNMNSLSHLCGHINLIAWPMFSMNGIIFQHYIRGWKWDYYSCKLRSLVTTQQTIHLINEMRWWWIFDTSRSSYLSIISKLFFFFFFFISLYRFDAWNCTRSKHKW